MKSYILSFVIAVMTLTIGCAQERATTEEATLAKAGDMAKDFTATMTDGSTIKLSDLKGKVVLINFWATWCGPCLREFNEIPEHIIERYKDKEFVFLPISREEPLDVVKKKLTELKKKDIDFPSGIDPDRSIYNLFATDYIPRNFLIDTTGKIVYTSVGYSEDIFQSLLKEIDQLVK